MSMPDEWLQQKARKPFCVKAGEVNAADLLKAIKGGLPYLLRYQTAKQKSQEPHADYKT
jgi:hypothetical protein